MLGALVVIPDVTIGMAGLLQLQDFQIRRQAGVIEARADLPGNRVSLYLALSELFRPGRLSAPPHRPASAAASPRRAADRRHPAPPP